jgi:hypothetical protein
MSTISQVSWASPSVVGGVGTGLKIFPATPGASIGAQSANPGLLPLAGNNAYNGKQFTVKATGNFQLGPGGACPQFSVGLYYYTFTGTVPSNAFGPFVSASATTSFQGNDGVAYPWALRAVLAGDSASGLIQLLFGSVAIDDTITTSSGLPNGLPSNINFAAAIPVAFGIGVSWSVSEPGNIASMYELAID